MFFLGNLWLRQTLREQTVWKKMQIMIKKYSPFPCSYPHTSSIIVWDQSVKPPFQNFKWWLLYRSTLQLGKALTVHLTKNRFINLCLNSYGCSVISCSKSKIKEERRFHLPNTFKIASTINPPNHLNPTKLKTLSLRIFQIANALL